MDKLLAKTSEIAKDRGHGKGQELSDFAVKALLGGINSDDWANYMKKFTTEPDELARLCGKDDTFKTAYQPQNLAYIVSNAICGTATGTGTHLRVDPNIDDPPPPV